jgi:hypothetical protein
MEKLIEFLSLTCIPAFVFLAIMWFVGLIAPSDDE